MSRSHPFLSARFVRTDLDMTRFGLATGRRLGNAVVRNRVRRRLRASLRSLLPAVRPGYDVLVVARPSIVGADQASITDGLSRVLARSGIIEGAGG